MGFAALAKFEKAVSLWEESSLRAEAKPPAKPASRQEQRLWELCVSARREGRPLLLALDSLRRLLDHVRTIEEERGRLRRMFVSRALVALGLALAVRYGLRFFTVQELATGIDGPALCFAGLCVVAAILGVEWILPRSWAWCVDELDRLEGFSAVAWSWAEAQAGRRTVYTAELQAWHDLNRQEMVQGISLRTEKCRVLERYAAAWGRRDKEQLRRIEDLMPLFELVGLGLPAALILLAPLMACLAAR